MGINGLLKALESIAIDRHLSYYRNKKMAVDGYCWLHKSVYLMSNEIITNPQSKKYLIYLEKRLEQLLSYNIVPVIIFDGDKLPMKKIEEDERQKHRNEVTKQGKTLLNQGLVKEAQAKMIEGLDINPQMAYEFIQELKKKKIEYYVAPYEADVQLAYLLKKNLVDCILTEDSDLIALGCKKVLFKLDPFTNIGKEISFDNRGKCTDYAFGNFGEDKFLTFCILAGCDYFKLKGVGIKNAYNAIKNVSSYTQCLTILNNKNPNIPINNETIEKFEKAFLTFRYQVIYCPIKKEMIYFNNIDSDKYKFAAKYLNDLSFLGKIYNKELTEKIVFGEIDPITHVPFNSKGGNQYDFSSKHNVPNVQFNIININNNNVNQMTMKVYSVENDKNSFLLHKRRNPEHKINSNKKISNSEAENYKEFELDMALDIRGDNEEKELQKNINEGTIIISSSSSSPGKESEDSVIQINNRSDKDKSENIDLDETDSLAELNEFDEFFEKYDKIDKAIKQNRKKGKIEIKINSLGIDKKKQKEKELIPIINLEQKDILNNTHIRSKSNTISNISFVNEYIFSPAKC